jgi:hypothetical protein
VKIRKNKSFSGYGVIVSFTFLIVCGTFIYAAPSCQNITSQLSDDYTEIIGNVDYLDPAGTEQYQSSYRWTVNGSTASAGTVSELLLLNFDGTTAGIANDSSLSSSGVSYGPGRWGQGLQLQSPGKIEYPRDKNWDMEEGTIEMWVALRANGDNAVYESHWHPLFYYSEPGGDWFTVCQSETGVIYAGGMVNGQWESAYGGAANMKTWPAGQWHHIAYTYSVSQNFMRFYLDGSLMADTNENHYWAPGSGSNQFVIGADQGGTSAHYYIDDVRILNRPASHTEIAEWAARSEPLKAFETRLDSTSLTPGDQAVFEFTPSNGSETGTPCSSDPVTWPGIPLSDPYPLSTLLPPGTTEVTFNVTSMIPTQCRYSVGTALPYAEMTDFDAGAGTTSHQTIINGALSLSAGCQPDVSAKGKSMGFGSFAPKRS